MNNNNDTEIATVVNVFFGFLWDNYNLNMATLYSIILSIVAIIGMVVFLRKYSSSNKSDNAEVIKL